MKRLLTVLLLIFTLLSFTACDLVGAILVDMLLPDIGDVEFPLPDGGNDDPSTGDDPIKTNKKYNSFSGSEKALFTSYFGFTIPFCPTNEYGVEEYTSTSDFGYEQGINYYTYGNTSSDFAEYRTLFSDFTFVETFVDDEGDVWYTYEKDGYYVDMSYYIYDMTSEVIDVYVYELIDSKPGGDGIGGEDDDIITNSGAGLPTDPDGVYDVDFTKAKKVKDESDRLTFLDGCPATSSPALLVIPVQFSDSRASSKGYSIDSIVNAFEQGGDNDYYSVYDYYYLSSYGQLTLDITVLDFWFQPKHPSTYYENAYDDIYGKNIFIGDQLILDEALDYLSAFMDLSDFDSDNNGVIDSIAFINTLEIAEDDFHWAYRYWNNYKDGSGSYYEYDGVRANDYMWASYQFLHDTVDGDGVYDNKDAMNTYTYIHEMAHVLGADDYYDYESVISPLEGHDVMDSMIGDHNPYSKFNFGWITSSRLIVTDSSVTVDLEAFAKSGDTVIIANNWDDDLGVYQEYFVIMYYTSEGLNGEDFGYFQNDGIVVYHVNASLYLTTSEGETGYEVYNNNTFVVGGEGTPNNLIEIIKGRNGNYTYAEGDTLPPVTDDSGNLLGYTFTVTELTDGYATVTFRAV